MDDNVSKHPVPKLKDVARKAGVSPTTASMVFTDTGRISEDTQRLVRETAEAMGYRHQARERRSLKTGRHVAVLVLTDTEWSFIWHFLTDLINEIVQDLEPIGLKTMMVPISHHDSDEVIYQKITHLGCRSVFSIHMGRELLFDRLERDGIPVILIMNNNYQDRFFSICADDFQGAYEGTRHLFQLGHRRIDFVDIQREDLPLLSTDRYYGYRKALDEEGVVPLDDYRIGCDVECSDDDLDEIFEDAMKRPDPPTALFCLDDEVAFRAWSALNRLGYSIPDDLSIIAPGDVLDYTKPYVPQISTMQIDMAYVGRLAVEMLNNRIKNEIDTVHVLKVKQQLRDRGSCRPRE